MGTKLNPGRWDCYRNALPDEPMFILLARDPSAPGLVFTWSDLRDSAIDDGERPESDRALVTEAHECAAAMREWRAANDGRWRTECAPPDPRDALIETLAAALREACDYGLYHGEMERDFDKVIREVREREIKEALAAHAAWKEKNGASCPAHKPKDPT